MKFIFFAVIFTLLFFVINRIAEQKLVSRYTVRVLSNAEESETLPAQLLYATMKKGHVFTDLSLPIPSKDGEEINIGIVAVNRAGVYIICRIQGEGVIENPNAARWKHIHNGSCSEFENPFRAQEGARNLIEYYAKNAGLSAVKAHSMLVYTSPSLRFTHTLNRSIVSADNLSRKLSDIDRRGRLTSAEVRQTCRLLSDISSGAYM